LRIKKRIFLVDYRKIEAHHEHLSLFHLPIKEEFNVVNL